MRRETNELIREMRGSKARGKEERGDIREERCKRVRTEGKR